MTSSRATELMPASAVKPTQNAAVMNAPVSGIDAGHQIQQASAAAELVGGDRGVGEDDGDRAEHARRRPVAHLEDVGDRVLREPAHARRDEEDQRDADPCARRLPQRGEPDAIAEPGAPEQAARADPRREQREHEHVRRQRPAGDQEIVAARSLAFLRLCHTPTAASTAR